MRYRTRKLANGKWVVEKQGLFRWLGLDAKNPGHAWAAGTYYYPDCWIDDEAKAQEIVKDHRARNGQ